MTATHIVYEADATRYEISVMFIENKKSDYDCQYLVSVVNFGECFFESDLNFIAEAIWDRTNLFSITDACNIQNGIAEAMPDQVCKVKPEFGAVKKVVRVS
jgi:hypothetical protein